MTRPGRLPDVAKRVLTMVEEFGLSKTNRIPRVVEKPDTTFKARPLDKKILEGRRMTRAQGRSTICPLDVKLATEERSKMRQTASKENVETEPSGGLIKAKPMPNYKFFEPAKKEEKKRVQFEEFDLETEKRAGRRATIVPEERTSFKAKPMPSYRRMSLGRVSICSNKELTETKPFNLETDKRASLRPKTPREEPVRTNRFKAREMPSYECKLPMTPRKSVTVPKEFNLQSAARSRSRVEFDKAVKEKQVEAEKEAKSAEEEEAEKLLAAIEQIRQMTVFKASQIRRYKPVPAPEQKELTTPAKFTFKTEQRARYLDWTELNK